MAAIVKYFVLVWCSAAAFNHSTMSVNDNKVIRHMISSFNGADNDFIVSEKNAKFFPLSKAMEMNKEMSRPDYNMIKDPEFGVRASDYLSEWRGFPRLHNQTDDRDIELLFKEGETFEAELIGKNLSKSDVLALPLSWQYLLPDVFYDSLHLPGNAWAEIVNARPMNAALLYKVALLLRDQGDEVKYLFIRHLNMPKMFREDLGYILGYRWGVDAVDDGDSDLADDSRDYNMKTLLHLPSDVVMGLDSTLYTNIVHIDQLLTDEDAWREASDQVEVLWFTKFLAESGWGEVGGSASALEQRGHVLTGAPLDRLRDLAGTAHGAANIAAVINRTDMNPLRVQELWEGVPQDQLQWMFFGQADRLDVTQLIAFYDDSFAYLYNEKAFLDREWLASDSATVPWASLMVAGLKHMARGDPASWQEKDLLDLGRFLVLLYPPQLDKLHADRFNAGVFDKVLSPRLTLSQRTVLYRKYLESSICTTSCPLPEVLMAAIPSQALLRLGAIFTPSTAEPLTVTFARDQASLVAASALYVPGQLHALHVVARPYLWQPATLATILSTHPQCLSDVSPHEFRTNIGHVVEAVYLTGPAGFHEMAESVQHLPRALLTAWLEAVLHMPGSSLMDGKWWNSDVLLDRNVAEDVEADGAVSPQPDHPLRQQFDRFSSSSLPRSALPSLALAGLSCHCIHKVQTPDSLEVLGLYRYHVESAHQLGHMPSGARKCWALKIRQFLRLKAELFGVTVETEPELLSLLSTSDIKAVGAEVLLTWGGTALAGITHPQVQHEVLMTIAHHPPHLFLHTGVGLDDVEYLAKTLLNSLLKHFDSVNLSVLTRLHNLLPFADDRILSASSDDARLYVSTVLSDVCKSVCLPAPARQRLRDFVVRGYGEPEVWSALDLVQLGDLLVVFSRADLARVRPTALRRAATQLSANTLYNERLADVRGFTDTALYHEACSAWLGAARPQEAAEFYKAWRGLGEFYILGSHLQVVVVEYNLLGAGSRRRRQTDEAADGAIASVPDFFKDLYVKIMKDMKRKFETYELTDVQKLNATTVITTTQELLGNASFKVLGLDIDVGMTVVDVFGVLKQYKDSGNMTDAQNDAMRDLAEDTQVRMVQGILGVFGYNATKAAEVYGVPEVELELLLVRESFNSTPAERLEDEALAALLPPTPALPAATTADPLLEELDLLTTPFPSLAAPRPDLSLPVFSRYEPVSPPLGPQFDSLPNINSGDIALSCDSIKAAGPAAAALSGVHIADMKMSEVVDCLDTLGRLAWPRQAGREIWQAVYNKVPGLKGTDGVPAPRSSGHHSSSVANKPLGREELLLLENLLPAVAEYNPGLIDLGRANIDGISLLGNCHHTSSAAGLLMQNFLNDNDVDADTNPLTSTEVASLGQLLCGLTPAQWTDLVTPDIFRDILTGHLARLDCSVAEPVRHHLAAMLLDLYGHTEAWTASDLMSAGWVAASLPPSSLADLSPQVMDGLAPRALRHLGPGRLLALDAEQLQGLSPHTASFIKRDQLLPYTSGPRRRAIRAAGGEDPEIHLLMKSLETSMSSSDPAAQPEPPADTTPEPEPSAARPPAAGSLAFLVVVFVMYSI